MPPTYERDRPPCKLPQQDVAHRGVHHTKHACLSNNSLILCINIPIIQDKGRAGSRFTPNLIATTVSEKYLVSLVSAAEKTLKEVQYNTAVPFSSKRAIEPLSLKLHLSFSLMSICHVSTIKRFSV